MALLAGVLLWLSCPPAGVLLWPLAWVAVAPLILSVTQARSFRQAAWRGYVFGWVYLGAVWYWVGLTIVAWTGSNIGWLAWFGLTLILAGFYGLWGGAAWWLAQRTEGGWRLVTLAAAWVVMEWARTLGALTMPWAQLSYTQYRFPAILQFADLTGAYGVSFLMLLVNGGLAAGWPRRKEMEAGRWLWLSLTLTALICLYGFARMTVPDTGKTLPVAAMQSDFNVRSTHDELASQFQTIRDLTERASANVPPPALYVWSESASPGDALYDPPARDLLSGLTQQFHTPLLVGSHVVEPQSDVEYNSSVLFLPDGSPPRRYDKQQLVPFGEFIPYRKAFPAFLTNSFQFFDKDVVSGGGATVLKFTDAKAGVVALGPFICYESMYPPYARAMTRAGANLLVTQSNDAWFQSKAAMEQHLAAVVLRAIENRREIVRATNTGITCFLDAKGRVTDRAPLNQEAFGVHEMRLLTGKTLYTRLGDWFVALCGGLLMIAGWRGRSKSPFSAPLGAKEQG